MKNGLIIENDGNHFYYLNDQLHCDDGPAVLTLNSKIWYQYGMIHRIDGPAMIINDRLSFWFYQNQKIDCESQQEFERLIKLKTFW